MSEMRERVHNNVDFEDPKCPACGEGMSWCLGHGEIGDPHGNRILDQHDQDRHVDCHPSGCEDARNHLSGVTS